jgi:hypothetical protein
MVCSERKKYAEGVENWKGGRMVTRKIRKLENWNYGEMEEIRVTR